ncbi:hypothetical protein [Nocardioides hankookensis]|uniref:Uncharacterized protein n=1 Tax=Nocardioides hankookensis TaxID=443157 RepID=A0ABW1LQG4_9ACTN
MNDLKQLLHDNVADAPADHVDVAVLVAAGRRRTTSRRRTAGIAAVGVLAATVLVTAAVRWPSGADHADPAGAPPRPDAPTIRLSDAQPAVEGRDYRVLASLTNRNLDEDNGQYFDGVTDDGLILLQDGPREARSSAKFALLDPATDAKDWLPDPGVGQDNITPVELGTDRLVLLSDNGTGRRVTAYLFDRTTREWSTLTWPGLPHGVEFRAELGPDGRVYFRVPATQGRIPDGGWPMGNGGEADDSNAEGDTFDLWSASLTDANDVRDEHLTLGDVAFTDSSMVWTDSTNGHAGQVHVRDLATGAEHSFDPHAGAKCNLLSFGATDDRILMSQYCGDYAGSERDDRVQVLSTDGEQVVTLQDSGIDGYLPPGSEVVAITAYADGVAGTYTYDLATNRFLRLNDAVGNWGGGAGSTGGARNLMWQTPVNHRHGATQWLGELLP